MFSINQLGKIYQLIQVRFLSFAFVLLEKKGEDQLLVIHPLKTTSMTQKSSKKITFMKSEHLDRPISWHEVLVGM